MLIYLSQNRRIQAVLVMQLEHCLQISVIYFGIGTHCPSADGAMAEMQLISGSKPMAGVVPTYSGPSISPLAGRPAPKEILVDVARLEREYFERRPDVNDPTQMVSFGTSGHRGSPLRGTFTEAHILAITQAICDYRAARASPVRFSWARIPTLFPTLPSAPRSRSSPPTALKP